LWKLWFGRAFPKHLFWASHVKGQLIWYNRWKGFDYIAWHLYQICWNKFLKKHDMVLKFGIRMPRMDKCVYWCASLHPWKLNIFCENKVRFYILPNSMNCVYMNLTFATTLWVVICKKVKFTIM
jgi:hypothetical protein